MTARRTIHVIDDDPAMRDSLAFLLDVNGFAVVTHETATEFLANLARNELDCIVSDIRMANTSRCARSTARILIASSPSHRFESRCGPD